MPSNDSSASLAPAETRGDDAPGPNTGDLKRASVRSFLWGAASWGSNRIVVLGLTLFLARVLVPGDFGVVTASLTIIAILDAALDFGVGSAVIARQESGVGHRTRVAMTLSIAIATVVSIAGVLTAPWLAGLFGAPTEAGVFALIFLYPFFRGLGQVSDAVLQRDLRFKRRTAVEFSRSIVRALVSVPLALTVGGAFSIAVGLIAAELAATLLLWWSAPVRPTLRLDRGTVRSLLGFGGQVSVIGVLGSFRSSFDYVVVGAALGTAALGFYGMAYKLPELIVENVLWVFTVVALPTYSRARSQGRDVLMSAMLRATRLISTYGLVAGATLAVIARDAMPLLFSGQWSAAILPMMLISISLGIMSIAWASGDVFPAMGRPGILLVLDIPATVLMGAAFLFSTQLGLVGVASVHLVFNVVYCIARLILLERVTKVGAMRIASAILPAVVVALAVAVAGFAVRAILPAGQWTSLAILVGTCAAVAAGVGWLAARSTVRELLDLVPGRKGAARARGTAATVDEPSRNA